MISWENYEEYIIMHADGELQPAEVQELKAFLDAHPELSGELKAYEVARFVPDEAVVYSGKDSLLRSDPSTRIIAFPQWRKYAIAAGIAALAYVSFYKYNDMDRNDNEVVKIDTVKPAIPQPQNHVPVQSPVTPVQSSQNVAVAPVRSGQAISEAPHAPVTPAVRRIHSVSRKQEAIMVSKKIVLPQTEIGAVAVTNESELWPKAQREQPVAIINEPVSFIDAERSVAKRSLWDMLPIDEDRKKNMEHLAGAVADIYNGISKTKQRLEETRLSIRIEDKKLKLSF